MSENIEKARRALMADGFLSDFMPQMERIVLLKTLDGEEGEGMAKILVDLIERIENMPATYDTDGQGDDAIVYLHYFGGSVDAWVTEKDKGDGSDDTTQYQAFGKQSLGYGAELGYICIQELIDNGIELDLYWTPKPLSEVKKGR